ncbi:hypothetical protein LCGC14_1825660 [marine sediment metagenome]|uniref:Uncharacterized protein n=1 Tax=marine sediment metagenome TaxID=412755 RepID=A0A0F9JH60_9ZZZZ
MKSTDTFRGKFELISGDLISIPLKSKETKFSQLNLTFVF